MSSFALNFTFDAVVMLTWSDWFTEPRSNRYHYATRFAQHLPVFFVQPDILLASGAEQAAIRFEPVPRSDITIIHIRGDYGRVQAQLLDRALKSRGVCRALLWIYNAYFEDYIDISRPCLRVFHATEDYVTPSDGLRAADPQVAAPIRRILKSVDLLIAVSDGVDAAYRAYAGYRGRSIVLRNGCDYSFWRDSGAQYYEAPPDGAPVALFQGGINERLDYDLLCSVARRLQNWRFWFCGDDRDAGPGWRRLLAQPNVVHFGKCSVAAVADCARQAMAGIIPFRQDPWIERSLPLKAYEYVACGLPVVSVPIDALRERPDLFTIETTAGGFAAAIERLAPSRTDLGALARRRKEAKAQSYDRRFAEAAAAIHDRLLGRHPVTAARLNVLALYDEGSTHVRTIYEHLRGFEKYSRHRYFFASATTGRPVASGGPPLDFSAFDAIVIHYSVRISVPQHIANEVADAVCRYRGPKLLFIQDEYENTETARQWIERLGVDTVFTNVPLDQVQFVYPPERFSKVDFVPTLTGYVPEAPELDDHILPLAERPIWLGYRGRQLPHHYGVLGHDKYRIGRDMRELCRARGIPADIEVDNSRRIYGSDWYRFIGSCRAVLATESGSNVFDDDGRLKALAERYAHCSFDEFAARFLSDVPTPVNMGQVSPKIFEAIRLKTALVLFEGRYSGVIEPDRHYIALNKDYSNVDAVFGALADLDRLQELTERAYLEIVEEGRYCYKSFVDTCDCYVEERAGRVPRASIIAIPAVAFAGHMVALRSLSPFGANFVADRFAESGAELALWRVAVTDALDGYMHQGEDAGSASHSAANGEHRNREAEIDRLNTVNPAKIDGRDIEIERINTGNFAELASLDAEIERLNAAKIEGLDTEYPAKLVGLNAEIDRLNTAYTNEISRLNAKIMQLNTTCPIALKRFSDVSLSNVLSSLMYQEKIYPAKIKRCEIVTSPNDVFSERLSLGRAGWLMLPVYFRSKIIRYLEPWLKAVGVRLPDRRPR